MGILARFKAKITFSQKLKIFLLFLVTIISMSAGLQTYAAVTSWDVSKPLDQTFWAQNPTDYDIKCALFGANNFFCPSRSSNKDPKDFFYTKYWPLYDNNYYYHNNRSSMPIRPNNFMFKVIHITSENTNINLGINEIPIYIMETETYGGKIKINNDLQPGLVIISKIPQGTTIYSNSQKKSIIPPTSFTILDNITIDGTNHSDFGLGYDLWKIPNHPNVRLAIENLTINNVKIKNTKYGAINLVTHENENHNIFINNLTTFNNKVNSTYNSDGIRYLGAVIGIDHARNVIINNLKSFEKLNSSSTNKNLYIEGNYITINNSYFPTEDKNTASIGFSTIEYSDPTNNIVINNTIGNIYMKNTHNIVLHDFIGSIKDKGNNDNPKFYGSHNYFYGTPPNRYQYDNGTLSISGLTTWTNCSAGIPTQKTNEYIIYSTKANSTATLSNRQEFQNNTINFFISDNIKFSYGYKIPKQQHPVYFSGTTLQEFNIPTNTSQFITSRKMIDIPNLTITPITTNTLPFNLTANRFPPIAQAYADKYSVFKGNSTLISNKNHGTAGSVSSLSHGINGIIVQVHGKTNLPDIKYEHMHKNFSINYQAQGCSFTPGNHTMPECSTQTFKFFSNYHTPGGNPHALPYRAGNLPGYFNWFNSGGNVTYSAPRTVTTKIIPQVCRDADGNQGTGIGSIIITNIPVLANSFSIQSVGFNSQVVNRITKSNAREGTCGTGDLFAQIAQNGNLGNCTIAGDKFSYTPTCINGVGTTDTCKIKIMDNDGSERTITVNINGITCPPFSGTLTINDGATMTNSNIFNLKSTYNRAHPIKDMSISCDEGITWTRKVRYNPNYDYTISSNCTDDGNKIIMMRLTDKNGNGGIVQDNIIYDTTAPIVEFTSISRPNAIVLIKDPRHTNAPGSGFMFLTAISGLSGGQNLKYLWIPANQNCPTRESQYQTKNLGNYNHGITSLQNIRIPAPTDGIKALCIYSGFYDRAGNPSILVKSSGFDFSPPANIKATLVINNGANSTDNPILSLVANARGTYPIKKAQFSCNQRNRSPEENCPGANGCTIRKSWNLNQSVYGCNTNPGIKTVYVKFKDSRNNTAIASDNIIYNNNVTPPANLQGSLTFPGLIEIAPNIYKSDSLTVTADSRSSLKASYILQSNGNQPSGQINANQHKIDSITFPRSGDYQVTLRLTTGSLLYTTTKTIRIPIPPVPEHLTGELIFLNAQLKSDGCYHTKNQYLYVKMLSSKPAKYNLDSTYAHFAGNINSTSYASIFLRKVGKRENITLKLYTGSQTWNGNKCVVLDPTYPGIDQFGGKLLFPFLIYDPVNNQYLSNSPTVLTNFMATHDANFDLSHTNSNSGHILGTTPGDTIKSQILNFTRAGYNRVFLKLNRISNNEKWNDTGTIMIKNSNPTIELMGILNFPEAIFTGGAYLSDTGHVKTEIISSQNAYFKLYVGSTLKQQGYINTNQIKSFFLDLPTNNIYDVSLHLSGINSPSTRQETKTLTIKATPPTSCDFTGNLILENATYSGIIGGIPAYTTPDQTINATITNTATGTFILKVDTMLSGEILCDHNLPSTCICGGGRCDGDIYPNKPISLKFNTLEAQPKIAIFLDISVSGCPILGIEKMVIVTGSNNYTNLGVIQNTTSCTSGDIILQFTGYNPNLPYNRFSFDRQKGAPHRGTNPSQIITGNRQKNRGYTFNQGIPSATTTGQYSITNIDKSSPTLSNPNPIFTGNECETITGILKNVKDTGCGNGAITYKRRQNGPSQTPFSGINCPGNTCAIYSHDTFSGFLNYSIRDSIGNATTGKAFFVWKDIPVSASGFDVFFNFYKTTYTGNWKILSNASAAPCETLFATVVKTGAHGNFTINGDEFKYESTTTSQGNTINLDDDVQIKISDGDGISDQIITIHLFWNTTPPSIQAEFSGGPSFSTGMRGGKLVKFTSGTDTQITMTGDIIALDGSQVRLACLTGHFEEKRQKIVPNQRICESGYPKCTNWNSRYDACCCKPGDMFGFLFLRTCPSPNGKHGHRAMTGSIVQHTGNSGRDESDRTNFGRTKSRGLSGANAISNIAKDSCKVDGSFEGKKKAYIQVQNGVGIRSSLIITDEIIYDRTMPLIKLFENSTTPGKISSGASLSIKNINIFDDTKQNTIKDVAGIDQNSFDKTKIKLYDSYNRDEYEECLRYYTTNIFRLWTVQTDICAEKRTRYNDTCTGNEVSINPDDIDFNGSNNVYNLKINNISHDQDADLCVRFEESFVRDYAGNSNIRNDFYSDVQYDICPIFTDAYGQAISGYNHFAGTFNKLTPEFDIYISQQLSGSLQNILGSYEGNPQTYNWSFFGYQRNWQTNYFSGKISSYPRYLCNSGTVISYAGATMTDGINKPNLIHKYKVSIDISTLQTRYGSVLSTGYLSRFYPTNFSSCKFEFTDDNIQKACENKQLNISFSYDKNARTPFMYGQTPVEDYGGGDHENISNAFPSSSYSGNIGFLFYISEPRWTSTGRNTNKQTRGLGNLGYDIYFSQPVNDEFFYIKGSAIVNGYKKDIQIKKPTFNYKNPDSYQFNFPRYE